MSHAGPVLWPLLALQLLVYVDRGILPACSLEINHFIRHSTDTTRPDLFLGVLQSAFIVGLCLACPLVAHKSLSRSVPYLIACSMTVWLLGEVGTFLSYSLVYEGAYLVLLVSRVLTGAGEAALVSLVPPLVLKETTASSWWLGIFCSVIPVGVALGFVFGSVANSYVGWNGAYLILGLLSLPLIVYNAFLAQRSESRWMAVAQDAEDHDPRTTGMWLLRVRPFLWLCVAYAAYAATAASFSTFGPSFMVDTQTAMSEAAAASALGIVIGLAGVLGSLLGGSLLTEADSRKDAVWVPHQQGELRQQQRLALEAFMVHEEERLTVIAEEEEFNDSRKLSVYLTTMIPVMSIAVVLFAILPWIPYYLPFLLVLGIALSLLFSAQVAFNICGMLAVSKPDRPYAVAMLTLFLHAAGDVPAPLLVGLLKDQLAPNCVTLLDPSQGPTSSCLAESFGIRLTEEICGLWLLWSLLGICRARASAR